MATVAELEAQVKALREQIATAKRSNGAVEIVDYTSKGSGETHKYVKTKGFPVGNGKMAQGLFLRVEAVDAAIEALQKAKTLLQG